MSKTHNATHCYTSSNLCTYSVLGNADKTDKVPKKKDSDKKSGSKIKIEEQEWDDFLENKVYEDEKDIKEQTDESSKKEVRESDDNDRNEEHTKGPRETESLKNESTLSKAEMQKQEHERLRKKVTYFNNKWRWFHKFIKDLTDGEVILPKELPEEEDEIEECESNDEDKREEIKEELPNDSNDINYITSTENDPCTAHEKETPAKHISDGTMPSQPSTETPHYDTKTIQPPMSTDDPEISDSILRTQDGETGSPRVTNTPASLQESWTRFLLSYEQCTGIKLDLPEELPDEADEDETIILDDEVNTLAEDDEKQETTPQVLSKESPTLSTLQDKTTTSLTQQEDIKSEEEKPDFPGYDERFHQRK